AHGPHAGPLAQGDPTEQHDRAGDHRHRAEAQPGVARHALVEHVPGVEAEPGADLQRHARPVEDEAGVQLDETAGHERAYWRRLALKSIASCEIVACMPVGVSGPYLARLLGGWRAAGPAY